MSVLKFRAWDGKEFLPLAREVAFIDDDGCLRSRIEGIIFNQFTGLTDRLGKEIYEGDILGLDDEEDTSRAVVVFHNGAFKPQLLVNRERPLYDDCDDDWIVIGNRFEDLELLTLEGGQDA